MDFDKVERFFAQTGIAEFDEDVCVSSKVFDACHAELIATRRALELAVSASEISLALQRQALDIEETTAEQYVASARTQLAQEAKASRG